MTDDARRTEVVSLAVYPETKEEWNSAVENDPNCESVSQLVRIAVGRYLRDQSENASKGVSRELDQQLTEVRGTQEQVAQRLDEIKGQLSDVRENVQKAPARPEIEELAGDLLGILPSESELDIEPVLSDEYSASSVPPPEPGSIEWIGERVDASNLDIKAALEHLLQSLHTVKRTEDGRYYKEV